MYDDLIMTGGVSKIDVIKSKGINLMIDDKPELFYEVKEAGLDTTMVCIDYKYNQGVPCDI